MSAPDHSYIVHQTADEYENLLEINTEESILRYMQILGPRLATKDANWGYLTKSGGEKHLTLPNGQFIAVDSFIYRATQQVVDTLTNAVDPGEAGPTWIEKEKRPDNNWYPISGGSVEPPSTECNCKAEIADLQHQIHNLSNQVAELQKTGFMIHGRRIALKALINGKFFRVKMESPTREIQAIADESQSYEEFEIKDMGVG